MAEAIELRVLVEGPLSRARHKLTPPAIAGMDELSGFYSNHGEPRRRQVEGPLRLPPSPIRRVNNQTLPLGDDASLLASEVAREKGVGLYTTRDIPTAKVGDGDWAPAEHVAM